MTHISRKQIIGFQTKVLDFYAANARSMPWRLPDINGHYDPYKILVSEIMLQQTQVARVVPKYLEFLDQFPSVQNLANANLGDVLMAWSGLGYNRRAKYLWEAARGIVAQFDGVVPTTLDELKTLPGVGTNTAGAIIAYAYNSPVVFIETNIRTVYIYCFYKNDASVSDKTIYSAVEVTLPKTQIRDWYYALMDYGAYIKASEGNFSTSARSYKKQAAFVGSSRQLRGIILRVLARGPCSLDDLTAKVSDGRMSAVLDDLIKERLVHLQDEAYVLG